MEYDNSVDAQLAKRFRHIDRRHHLLLMRSVSNTALHRAQHILLMAVAHHEGQSQCVLARHMEVSTAAVTVALKKLEKLGYIWREVDEQDNRYNRIYTTEAGKELVEESRRIFHQIDTALFDGFSDEEKQQLIGYYDRVLENIERMEQIVAQEPKEEIHE